MVLDTSNPDLSFPGSTGLPYGWYLSTAAPYDVHIHMNKELLKIQENCILKSIMSRNFDDAGGQYAMMKMSIAPGVIMLPMLFTLLPIFLGTFCLIAMHILQKVKDSKAKSKGSDSNYNTVAVDFEQGRSFASYKRFWSRQNSTVMAIRLRDWFNG